MRKMTQNIPTIKQANQLILAGQNITLQSKRLLYFMAKNIDPNGENPKQVVTSWANFQEFVQAREPKNWRGKKRILKKILKNLNDNPVEIEWLDEKGKRKYTLVNWVQSIELAEDNDTVEMMFTDKLIPFLLFLKNQPYTKTIYEIGHFRSIHTIRIKEILETERFKQQPYCDIELEKLKWMLGLQNKYKEFRDFKRRVLNGAQEELLKTNSPVRFTYDTISRHGRPVKRNVHSIRFYPEYIEVRNELMPPSEEAPQEQPTPEAPPLENQTTIDEVIENTDWKEQHPKLYEKLNLFGITESTILGLLQQHGIDYLQEKIAITEAKVKAGKVGSPAGFFMAAVVKDFKSEEQQKTVQQAAAKAKREKREEAEQAERERERQLAELKSEYSRKRKAVCDDIIKQHPFLLQEGYNIAAKQAKNYPPTPQEAYESIMYSWRIIKAIEGMFTEQFTELYSEYAPKVQQYGGKIEPIQSYIEEAPQEEKQQPKTAGQKARERLGVK